jgi:hypothetical protein
MTVSSAIGLAIARSLVSYQNGHAGHKQGEGKDEESNVELVVDVGGTEVGASHRAISRSAFASVAS